MNAAIFARLWRRAALGILLFGTCGCFHVRQMISLHADGSGEFHAFYSAPLEVIRAIEEQAGSEAGEGEGPVQFSFDESQIREDFKDYEAQGIRLEHVAVRETEGRKEVELRIWFESLNALARTEFLSDRQILLRRLEDGSMEFAQIAPPIQPAALDLQESLREALKGFRAELAVETPADILEANADRMEGRRAVWMFDVDRDPDALRRVQLLNLRVRFAAVNPPMREFP
ncbi:MAG: hypothetical protein NZ740_01615 [Kiritimatiellae bacterium]|nr:hypothetical protein [Kiritimatiellia bacterium]MDW8457789.1 hypothetical protein [Verrucomicrobiota bacterium]